MKTREEAIKYCMSYGNTYEDYPFHDANWTVMRHKGNDKTFALIFERNGNIWVNLKGKPEWCDFYRNMFESVIPAYHMNKTHWNSVILDTTVPDEEIRRMIDMSYELTKPKIRNKTDGK